MPPAIGIARIHAHSIFSTVHLIAFDRFAVPTPVIADEMWCVVDTGMPRCDAAKARPPRCFRRGPTDRMRFHELVAQRLDGAPAAKGGARRHHERAGDPDSDIDVTVLERARGRVQEWESERKVVERAFGLRGHDRVTAMPIVFRAPFEPCAKPMRRR